MARATWTSQRVTNTVLREVALQRQEFARRLVALREERRLTQEKAAEMIGVSLRQYTRWESARATAYLSSIDKIATAFDIDPQQLIVDEPTGPALNGHAGDLPTRDDLARLERKIDQILTALGATDDLPDPPDELADALRAPGKTKRPRR